MGTAEKSVAGFASGWTLSGNASQVSTNVIQLTPDDYWQGGSAFFARPVPTGDFTASFTFDTPSPDAAPADGVSFVLQNDNRGLSATGTTGSSLGYAADVATGAGGVLPSAALLIDIYAADGNGRGLRVATNGSGGGGTATNVNVSTVDVDLTNPVTCNLSYNATAKTLTVSLVEGPHAFAYTFTASDLPSILGQTAYVGFTGATGVSRAQQQISNFLFTSAATPAAVYPNTLTVSAGVTGNVSVVGTSVNSTITLGPLTMGAGATLNLSAAGSSPSDSNSGLTVGATTLNATPTFQVANHGTGTGTLTLGTLTDGGTARTITKQGPGTLTLGTAATSLVDGAQVNIANGTLRADHATALGMLAKVDVASGTMFRVGASQTVGALSGSGNTTLNGQTLTVGSTNNLSGTFSGVISDGAGTGGLTKAGTGIWTLTGSNTHSGATSVRGGTLSLQGPNGRLGAISLAGGSLAGNGTVAAISMAGAGTVSPGDGTGDGTATAGILHSGDVAWDTNTTFLVELFNGTGPGSGHDQLQVTGNVRLGNATLDVRLGSLTPVDGTSYRLVDNDGTDPVAGAFRDIFGNVLANGTGFTVGGLPFRLNYLGGDGNDVVLTFKEPQVTVAVSPETVLEDGSTNLVYTFTRTGSTFSSLTVCFAVSGAATFPIDYTPAGAAAFGAMVGTVTIPSGSNMATVTIDPTPDATAEPNEDVVLTITAGTGYGVGLPATATGLIQDDDNEGANGTRLFDFNTPESPSQAGYTGVLPTDVYSASRGYGWDSALVSNGYWQQGAVDRGPLDDGSPQVDLRRDYHASLYPHTFSVDVPDGTYWLNVTIGDATIGRDKIQIVAEADSGYPVLSYIDAPAGTWGQAAFAVVVTDGRLELQFSDLGGDRVWLVNGLEIRRMSDLSPITYTHITGPVVAPDGLAHAITGTASTGAGVLRNTMLTLTCSLGTMTSDASAQYAGTQVLTDADGVFSFDIVTPAIAGTPRLTFQAIDGSARASQVNAAELDFAHGASLEFTV